jgi:hypothetical protein
MFTIHTVAALVTMAGLDFRWQGIAGAGRPSGGARKGGRVRVGMRLWLHAAQGGLCVTCGNPVDALLGSDLAHVVGSGPARSGWVAGNIYLSHASCNVGVAREAWENGSLHGGGITDAARLAALDEYTRLEGTLTLMNTEGQRLVLSPRDFARADLIATEWPVSTVGAFIRYDPAFEGKR